MTQFGVLPTGPMMQAGVAARLAQIAQQPLRDRLKALETRLDELAGRLAGLIQETNTRVTEIQRAADRRLLAIETKMGGYLTFRDTFHLAPSPKTLTTVLTDAVEKFHVSRIEILGRGRNSLFVEARRYAAKRLRNEFGMSYPQIGKLLNRDHTTIMNLCEPKEQRPWAEQKRMGAKG